MSHVPGAFKNNLPPQERSISSRNYSRTTRFRSYSVLARARKRQAERCLANLIHEGGESEISPRRSKTRKASFANPRDVVIAAIMKCRSNNRTERETLGRQEKIGKNERRGGWKNERGRSRNESMRTLMR